MNFLNTFNSDKVTSDDIARWSEELGKLIRENPNDTGLWLERVYLLYRKIDAVHNIYSPVTQAADGGPQPGCWGLRR